jgi:WXG100 family type VII secretion target
MITIRIEYDDMESVSSELNRLTDDVSQAYNQLQQQCQVLMDGEWLGAGARIFYDEFENVVSPAMNRLINAMTNASAKVQETSAKFDDAENECKIKIEVAFN